MADELIARIASIKEQDAPGRNIRDEFFGFLSLGGTQRNNCSGDGQTSKDIVGCGNQTLRIVSFATVLESALWIEHIAKLLGSGEVVFRAIVGKHRHAMPGKLRALRPALVGQINSISEDVSEDSPIHLASRFGQGGAVDGFGLRP